MDWDVALCEAPGFSFQHCRTEQNGGAEQNRAGQNGAEQSGAEPPSLHLKALLPHLLTRPCSFSPRALALTLPIAAAASCWGGGAVGRTPCCLCPGGQGSVSLGSPSRVFLLGFGGKSGRPLFLLCTESWGSRTPGRPSHSTSH